MAISASERADILELVVLMFDAAPGAAYLQEIVSIYEAGGHDMAALAQALGQTGAFAAVHPNFETAEEFATRFLSRVGLQGDSEARDWVISQFNAGTSKAAIIEAGWAILDGMGETAAPQYLAAKAIMENKAEVADFHSVVLHKSSTDLAALQSVLRGVGADSESVDAALRELSDAAAQGPVLTRGADDIQVPGSAHTVVAGLIDGDGGSAGTYTPGDRIRGNGNTDLELTIVDGGAAGFVRLEGVNKVSLVAGTDEAITINAGGWAGVGSVRLDDGVSGMDVLLTNLQAGTSLAIAEVRGSIAANYRVNGDRLFAELRNDDRRGDGGTLAVSAAGNVTAQMADEVSVRLIAADDIALGNIAIDGGSDASALLRFDGGDEVSVGDVRVAMGDEVSIAVTFEDIDDEVSAGDIALAAGDESAVSLRFEDLGDVTVGAVSLSAGDESALTLLADGTGDVSIESIELEAGEDSTLSVAFAAGGAASLQAGDVSLRASGSSSLGVSVQGYDEVTLGDVTLESGAESAGSVLIGDLGEDGVVTVGDIAIDLGDESTATVFVGLAASVQLGDITEAVGESGTASVAVQAFEDASVGVVTQTAGDESALSVAIVLAADGGDLSVGGYAGEAGDESTVAVSISNQGDKIGSTTVGNVSASVGDDGTAMLAIIAAGTVAPTKDSAEATAGNFSVGDVTLSAGDVMAIDSNAGVSAQLLYGGKAQGAEIGDMAVGDIHLSVGDGFVSGTMENRGVATLTAIGVSGGTLGDATFGDVTLEGGDFSMLQATYGGVAAMGEDGGSVGDATFGTLAMSGGENALMQAAVFWGALAADSVGNASMGGLDVHAKEDSMLGVAMLHGVVTGPVESVGDWTVGDMNVEMGDNSEASVALWQRANYGGLEADANGDVTIGNIHIAVSATSTDDLSGGSSIQLSIRKEVHGMDRGTGGALSVGDVSLWARADSSVNFALSYTGTMEQMGDVTIGGIALAVGDDGTATGVVRLANDGGDFGDVDLGNLSLSLGEGAEGSIALATEMTDSATIGNFSIGDVSIDADKGAVADLTNLGISARAVGAVTLGDADIGVGAGAAAAYEVQVQSATTIGAVTIGDRSIELGKGAEATLWTAVSAEGNVGAVKIGDLSLDLAQGAYVEYAGASISGAKVGGTTIGNTEATVTDGAAANIAYVIEGSDIGRTIVGDVHLTVADGGALTDDTDDADPLGGTLQFSVDAMGDSNDHLQVGNITIDVAGTAADDRVLVSLATNANIAIGDLTVTGKGLFSFDADDWGDDNTSVLAITAGTTRTIGNVDFSGYAGNADIDLSWTTGGAASITGGAGNDMIVGNAGNNVIAGGKGVDTIDLGLGGNDTVVTNKGESGVTLATIDTIVGFTAGSVVSGAFTGGDKLDFNLVAGSAGNYVERAEDFSSFAEFLSNARDALNSSVRYFVQDDGTDTYVAVNFGSGEANLVVKLAGVSDATSLHFQNFIA